MKNRINYFLILGILILIAVALTFGTKTINILNLDSGSIDYKIIYDLRLPRIIAALISGMTLAASGVLIQASLKNPLADSSILGFQSGASLMAMCVILIFPNMYQMLPFLAFIGGMLTFAFVFLITLKKQSGLSIILAGLAINSIVGSIISFISVLYADKLENTVSWMSGSLNSITMNDAKVLLVYGLIILVIIFIFKGKINILELDDSQIANTGTNPNKIRLFFASLAVFAACISTSIIGIIGFVGLISPHIARSLIGKDNDDVLPLSVIFGGFIVLLCDTLQRIIIPFYEIPVGTILAIVGGIFFLILIIKEKNA